MSLTLRPYQREAVEFFKKACIDGESNRLMMPTGSGITVTTLTLLKERYGHLAPDTALIVHSRREMAAQTDRIIFDGGFDGFRIVYSGRLLKNPGEMDPFKVVVIWDDVSDKDTDSLTILALAEDKTVYRPKA